MRIDQSPVHDRNNGRPPDNIDGLLRSFLRAEMPDPWPVMKPPALPLEETSRGIPSRWSGASSRFALAATVGLCLAGSLLLATAFPSLSSTKSGTPAPDLIAPLPEEFRAKTSNGKHVTGVEQHKGKTTIITIRLLPMPAEGEE